MLYSLQEHSSVMEVVFMAKKVIVNSIFLFFLIVVCVIHIFCLIPQRYSLAIVPILMFFPFVFIAFDVYCSKKQLFLTGEDIDKYPKLKLLSRSISVFQALFWILMTVWFITRRG